MTRARSLLALVVLLAAAVTPAAAAPGHLDGWIPAAAHTPGLEGSFWTTDVWIYNQGASAVHLWFNRAGADNSAVDSVLVTLDEPVVFLPDVVAETFGTDGLGSVHYLADGPVAVVSRTWTEGAEGGSFGQTIPGIPVARASAPAGGQAGALRMLVSKRPAFRANVGLVNVTSEHVTVAVEVFDRHGNAAGGTDASTVELEPYGMTQLGDVLAGVTAADGEPLVVRATVTSAQGAILAYLSEVDDRTNDGSYQEAFRFGF